MKDEIERQRFPAGGRSAFTLVELMVALGLLLIFGVMAVTTLSLGIRLWRSAHRRSYAYDVATVAFQQLDDDLGAAKSQFWGQEEDAFDTRVKFWVDYDKPGRQRLRFIRGIPDATVNPRLRQAGDGVSNDDDNGDKVIDESDDSDEEYYNLKDDDDPPDGLVDEDLKALEGMCEVAYMMGLDGDDTLYRGVLGPISGPESLFGGSVNDNGQQGDDNIDSAADIDARAVAIAGDIIHFEVRLWTQYTTTWDADVPFQKWSSSYEPEACGPAFTWDSDRLPGGSSSWSPDFVMDRTTDGQWDEEDYVRDNVFPRSVMVVIVVDPTEQYPLRNPPRLRETLTKDGMEVKVRGDVPPYNEKWPYLLIGDEWIRFERFAPDDQGGSFIVAERAARGTAAASHSTGERIRFGYTFSRIFHNPANRDCWDE